MHRHDCWAYGARVLMVAPNTTEAFQVGCDGPMCDQNNLLRNNVLVGSCACMQMDKSGKVMISMGLEVIGRNGDSFRGHFASKWFMSFLFILVPFPWEQKHRTLPLARSRKDCMTL